MGGSLLKNEDTLIGYIPPGGQPKLDFVILAELVIAGAGLAVIEGVPVGAFFAGKQFGKKIGKPAHKNLHGKGCPLTIAQKWRVGSP